MEEPEPGSPTTWFDADLALTLAATLRHWWQQGYRLTTSDLARLLRTERVDPPLLEEMERRGWLALTPRGDEYLVALTDAGSDWLDAHQQPPG